MRTAAALLVLALALTAPPAQAQTRSSAKPAAETKTKAPPAAITLTPAVVEAGSPELIRIETHTPHTRIEAQWLGHTIHFFKGPATKTSESTWYALAGVDVEARPGPSTLSFIVDNHTGAATSIEVQVHPGHYHSSAITVEPRFVEPPKEAEQQIKSERELKAKIFSTTDAEAGEPKWSGSFKPPVNFPPTDSFGTRRTFNGKLDSVHKGTDFRAPSGTPVLAGNSGTVILAQPLYYEGNCVMIDHGQGLVSISMHLSKIEVKTGEKVTRGQRLGLSGATGRVTGPHLHWAIRWQGTMLDPARLLKLNLTNLPR